MRRPMPLTVWCARASAAGASARRKRGCIYETEYLGASILLKHVLNLFPKLTARRWPLFQKRFCGQEPVAGQGSTTLHQGDYRRKNLAPVVSQPLVRIVLNERQQSLDM